MIKEDVIINLGRQLESVAKRIQGLAEGIAAMKGADPRFCEDFDAFLLDEVAHVQILALGLTQAVTEEDLNGDDAFGPGELESVIGEKAESPPEEEAE